MAARTSFTPCESGEVFPACHLTEDVLCGGRIGSIAGSAAEMHQIDQRC